MEIYKAESLPEESRVFSENILETTKTEFHHQHQKGWDQFLTQCYGIFYLDCISLVKSFWHFNSWETQGMIQSRSLNVIKKKEKKKKKKSEGDTGFVVQSKEVGELSNLPLKISQLSSYQDDMDREPWYVGAMIPALYILSPFNTIPL